MTATLYGTGVDIDTDRDARLTIREVAALLDLSTDTVRTMVYARTLPSELDVVDKNYRIRRGDVDDYLAGRLQVDPSPMFTELGALADEIAASEQRTKDLIERRNRALVMWVDDRRQSVTAAAKAAKLSRDRANTALRVTRAQLGEEAARLAGVVRSEPKIPMPNPIEPDPYDS